MSNNYQIDKLAIDPEYIAYPLSWIGHIPFVSWLVNFMSPNFFVELGTYSGTSYFAVCQSVAASALSTKCFAVDTWKGDDHTGGYDGAVFDNFKSYHDARYTKFSRYLRMFFDDAVVQFEDGSIDLLHIDGLHTYSAVKHDFELWLPKMSSRGVVLFHDAAVEAEGFGVKEYWAELSAQYPSILFKHSNGLGVLLVGESYKFNNQLLDAINNVYLVSDLLAERLWLQQMYRPAVARLEALEHKTIPTLEAVVAEKESLLSKQSELNMKLAERLAKFENSKVWKWSIRIKNTLGIKEHS